jgi:hypothetical protein
MKSCIRLICIAAIMMPLASRATQDLPVVEKLRNGFYASAIDLDGRIVKRYVVDTKAQLCFSSSELIPCENLKMRDEWKGIISW